MNWNIILLQESCVVVLTVLTLILGAKIGGSLIDLLSVIGVFCIYW